MNQAGYSCGRTPCQGDAIRRILEGTAPETGRDFFRALVRNLAAVLDTHGAWVTEYLEDKFRLRALAFWLGEGFIEEYEYDITGTPCEPVMKSKQLVHFADDVSVLFPGDPDLEPMGAVGYMGVPLLDTNGAILGHLAILDNKVLPRQEETEALFRIFAARAAAELRRLHADKLLRQREDKLSRLVGSAMDAIIEVDADCIITHCNHSAESIFADDSSHLLGCDFRELLTPGSADKLKQLITALSGRNGGRPYLWIPGGLQALRRSGETFVAEASLSCYQLERSQFFTLILRDVAAQLEAEQRVRVLTDQTEYLREELKETYNPAGIIGRSPAMRRVFEQIRQVADTGATVLLLGETGTGKELIARAIHEASRRADQPLIRVNCAAIPGSLIESEFFGHERGAFTGATQHRQGRFALADNGTIFLDEVGELPIELQAKLLRVLQEGEFQPVGSNDTKRVDARVIAATNCDLKQAVAEGKFREDLYYRLNVFPITIPALRERDDDILLLTEAFVNEFARESGKTIASLNPECVRRLMSYDWPGNVRELRNVVERAVITCSNGALSFDYLLPARPAGPIPAAEYDVAPQKRILTIAEFREIERANLRRALEKANWRVSGAGGAAALLGIPPSTFSSRMKSLGISKSQQC